MELKLDFTARVNLINQLCDLDFWTSIDTYDNRKNDNTRYEFYSNSRGLEIIINEGVSSEYNKVVFNWF